MTEPPKSRRKLIVVLAVLAVVGVAFLSQSRLAEESPEVTAARARRGTMIEYVRATGHLEPEERVRVSARVSGDLAKLFVQEGDSVKKGTLLASINPGVAQLQLNQRAAQARSVRAQETLEQARLARAIKKQKATEDLLRRGLVSQAESADAVEETRMARAQLQAAKHRSTQALAEVAEEQTLLGFAQVVAPNDGTVISIERREGERVRGSELAEDVLLTLAPLDRMRVDVEVSEQEVIHLRVGGPAEVRFRAMENLETTGQVDTIAATATVYNRGQLNEITRFKLSVMLKDVPDSLRPGMTAEVRLVARTRENAVLVPYESVTTRSAADLGNVTLPSLDGGAAVPPDPLDLVFVVFVVEDGVVQARPVLTGLASDSEVEILAGLEPGSAVVTGPFDLVASELHSGMSVSAPELPPETAAEPTPVATEKAP